MTRTALGLPVTLACVAFAAACSDPSGGSAVADGADGTASDSAADGALGASQDSTAVAEATMDVTAEMAADAGTSSGSADGASDDSPDATQPEAAIDAPSTTGDSSPSNDAALDGSTSPDAPADAAADSYGVDGQAVDGGGYLAACATSSECNPGFRCGYAEDGGCSTSGVCVPVATAWCVVPTTACACDLTVVNAGCNQELEWGYSVKPLLPGACPPNAVRCVGNGVQTCTNCAWSAVQPCPFLCSFGVCTGECTPGDTQCSSNGLQICDSTGTWQSAAACDAGACDAGGVVCPADAGQSE